MTGLEMMLTILCAFTIVLACCACYQWGQISVRLEHLREGREPQHGPLEK